MRLRRSRLVHVEGLRIVLCGKRLDLLGGEAVGAELDPLADIDVIEVLHAAGISRGGGRRMIIWGQVSVITFSPRSLNTCQCKVTKPRSGLLCDTRVPSTLPRTVRLSPGRTGFSQRTSSTPGAPMEA